jgi:hypothetical protein
MRYRPPTRTRGLIQIGTLQVISPRRIPSRSRLVTTIKPVYVQRCRPPRLQNAGPPTNVAKREQDSRHFQDSAGPRDANLNGRLIAAQPHRRGEECCGDGQTDPQPRTAKECSRCDMCHGPRWEHIVRGVKRWRGSDQSRPHQRSEMPGTEHDEFDDADRDQRQRSP